MWFTPFINYYWGINLNEILMFHHFTFSYYMIYFSITQNDRYYEQDQRPQHLLD
jgi:hypothetical protein